MKYNKLVRDKIPEYIKSKGGVPITHIADDKEYWQKLKEKLLEEINEFKEDESLEEFADLLEVIDAMIDYKKFDRNELKNVRAKKAGERGKFKDKIILDET
jgi:predicted house-cleaning noncanonical NTP pyrophosphatase (MazG superfamily)